MAYNKRIYTDTLETVTYQDMNRIEQGIYDNNKGIDTALVNAKAYADAEVAKRVLQTSYDTKMTELDEAISEKLKLNGVATNVNFIEENQVLKSANGKKFASNTDIVTDRANVSAETRIRNILKQFCKEYTSDGNNIAVDNGIDGYVLKGILQGQTVKNYCVPVQNFSSIYPARFIANTDVQLNAEKLQMTNSAIKDMLKPNTDYTMFVYINRLEVESDINIILGGSAGIATTPQTIAPNTTGWIRKDFTTPSSIGENLLYNASVTGIVNMSDIVIVERADADKVKGVIPFGLSATKGIISNSNLPYPLYKDESDKSNGIVITLGGVGGVYDTFEIKEDVSAVYTQRTKEEVVDKTKVTNVTLSGTGEYYYTELTIDGMIPNGTNVSTIKCNRLKEQVETAPNSIRPGLLSRISIRATINESTIDKMKEYIGDNLIIRYVLTTPVVTTIDKSLMPTIISQVENEFKFGENILPSSVAINVPIEMTSLLESQVTDEYPFYNGYLSNSASGVVSYVQSSTRIYSPNFINKSTRYIKANEGFCFRIMAFSSEDVTVGNLRETGIFELTGTSKNLKEFDLTPFNYFGYKLTILKDDDSEITPNEGDNAIEMYSYVPSTYDAPNIENNDNRNLCLCAIKTDILNNKIPYHRGFLFHKLQNDDGSLWYGNNFDNINKIGVAGFKLSECLLAVSPKDGTVIATNRGLRGAMYIYKDGKTTQLFTSATLKPMGWLYNAGVDFVVDTNGVEHCIFSEYTGSINNTTGFYVWKGTYPYTSESDWKTTFYKSQSYTNVVPDTITHFHQVRKDPFSNVLYLSSGDKATQLNWWYSLDFGDTWNLLISDSSAGYTWEPNVLRCINFIFTKDQIFWATDFGTDHCLNSIKRDSTTGIIDLSTRVKLCDLPSGHATNSLCYYESPRGIFLYERIDSVFPNQFGENLPMLFWNIEKGELETVFNMSLTEKTWGGSRGKCYVNYTNSVQPLPAMGFSIDTPCLFDLISNDVSEIGTIAYNIGSKQIKTVSF